MKVFAFKAAEDQNGGRYMTTRYYVAGKSEKNAKKRFKKEFKSNFDQLFDFCEIESLSNKESKSMVKKVEKELSYYTNLMEMYDQDINLVKSINQREPASFAEVKISNKKKFKKKDSKKFKKLKLKARLLNIKVDSND